jgi:4-hydroxy-2-oxoheptanedioate aldolase
VEAIAARHGVCVANVFHAGDGNVHPMICYDRDVPGQLDHAMRANDEIMVIIQIEHIKAVERAEEILSVPGIDAMFIGPTDLSASMGLKPSGDAEDPRVREAIEHARKAAAKCGVASGIHVFSPEAVAQRIKEGFRFIALASDVRFMTVGAKSALARVKEIAKA